MAAVTETLRLEDRFSAAFSRFINLGGRAAGSSRLAQSAAANYEAVASSLDQRIIGLNAQISVLTSEQKELAASGNQDTAAYRRLEAQIGQLSGTLKSLKGQYDAVEKEAEEAAAAAEKFSTNSRAAGTASSGLMGTVRNLAGAFLGVQSVQWLVNTSDQLTNINARLQLMTGSAEEAAAANEQIYQAAMRARGSYTDMADTVASLGTLAGDAFSDGMGGVDTGQIVAFAEQLQKQMALSGTSTQAAQAAMLQLTQGLSSGVLRGEELNSILEQTPMIAKTIADYMGVTTGEMRELASEGAVTAEVVKNAVLGAAEETNAAFAQMPMTWGQVWTQMQNIAIQALDPILDGINWLANNIGTALNWVQEHADGIFAVMIGALTALGIAGTIAGAKMLAAGLQAAAGWIAANLPIVLVGASVAALIYAALKAGATFEQVGGVIGGVFGTVYAFAMNNFLVPLQRGFAAIANFIGNVFNNPVAAIIVLFYDMAIAVLENIRNMAQGIEDLIKRFRAWRSA